MTKYSLRSDKADAGWFRSTFEDWRKRYQSRFPAKPAEYESVARFTSERIAGARFTIVKMSFGRRMELTRRIREIGQRIEFLEAGSELREKIEATVLGAEIDRLYLEWGLVDVEGLLLDGEEATPGLLIEKGPEELTREILARIRAECGLSEEERKN